jgi:hypothetical protein
VSRCACRVLAIVAVAAACGKPSPAPAGAPSESPTSPAPAAAPAEPAAIPDFVPPAAKPIAAPSCTQLPFADSTPVPEASGAAWLVEAGKPVLLVVGDSGNHGAYGIVDPETGATIETGELPLSDEAGDDLEGIAVHGEKIYGLTSAGWVRSWRRHGKGFELVDKPYPLGPVTLPRTRNNNRAPEGDGMVCDAQVVNCGRNYEGLCLAAKPRSAACIGFAASKADGHLYCLTEDAGKLVVHHDRAIEITRPGALADCAFADDDTLWVGANMFDLGRVSQVVHWDDPATATLAPIGSLAVGFPEVIAVRGDVVYRMSDTGGAPSLMAKFRCPR